MAPGKWGEEGLQLREARRKAQTTLGNGHSSRLMYINNRAIWLQKQGKLDGAELLF